MLRQLSRAITATLIVVALASLLGPLAAPAEAAGSTTVTTPRPLPVSWNAAPLLNGIAQRSLDPNWHPAGSNDPTCRLTAAHPRPVFLVNFTSGAGWEWSAGSPYLRNNGYCVFNASYGNVTPFPNFPFQALGDVPTSAQQLKSHIDAVLSATGADKVDLVGWSQGGGLTPHYYLNFLGGAAKVHTFVGIAPGNHGATASGLTKNLGIVLAPLLAATVPALPQQYEGSDLALRIYAAGDTQPGVRYTTIVTKYDEIATPWQNQYLVGPNVTNILLQQGCALDRSEHVSIGFSERTWRHVLNALSPATAKPVPCQVVLPFLGSGL
ncbi:MAG: triacylglycerol lipase [Marmoricola sp.]|nr:triacylglycerol lipase [Marmoricola sp.]